nr:DUF1472 domain-containing protein [Salmonella enterica subsp. houtenae serovar 18:z36,z38:-]
MAAPSLRDVAWWFSTLSVRCRVRAVPCIHRSRAVVDTRVRWRRCGHPVLPSRQPRSSGRSPAQVSRSHPPAPVCRARQAAASLAPLYLRPIARLVWMHGTARCRRLCDYGDFYAVFKSAVRARY